MAEYFRRHPEFLEFQDDLVISLCELQLEVAGECLDVRDDAGQYQAGIAHDRLIASEKDEGVRYAECRELARGALARDLVGIAFPSAAAAWTSWNLVLFGDPITTRWVCLARTVVDRPHLSATDVRTLP